MGLRSGTAKDRFTRSAGDAPFQASKAITGSVRVRLVQGESGKVEVQSPEGFVTRWSFESLASAAEIADDLYWDTFDESKAWNSNELLAGRVVAAVLVLAAHRSAIQPEQDRYWEAWDLAYLRRRVLLQ